MPKIKRTKQENGNISLVVDSAAELDIQIKDLEKKLEPLKNQIKSYVETAYTEVQISSGLMLDGITHKCKIVAQENREKADPETVLEYLTEQGKGERFFDCVSVQAKELNEIIGEEKSKELRPLKLKKYIIKQSFI